VVRELVRADMLKPVPPERYVIPVLIPVEAYTLLAGVLSSFKTLVALYLLVLRATGYDALNLVAGVKVEPGPSLYVFYEDVDWRIVNRLNRILQQCHRDIQRKRGTAAAEAFLDLAATNLHRLPLTGRPGMTLVKRIAGAIVPNHAVIDRVLGCARGLAERGVFVALDPLRLSIVGSQNDDEGAEVVVSVLNKVSGELKDGGLLVASHVPRSRATDNPESSYVDAAAATSGSILMGMKAYK
jgi:hypothetical protein